MRSDTITMEAEIAELTAEVERLRDSHLREVAILNGEIARWRAEVERLRTENAALQADHALAEVVQALPAYWKLWHTWIDMGACIGWVVHGDKYYTGESPLEALRKAQEAQK